MKIVEQLADFVDRASFEDLSPEVVEQIKLRVIDALGCAIGALSAPPMRIVHKMIDNLGHSDACTLMGNGKAAIDRAAFYNSALVRYLDFNDSYLAKQETCHPSDNIGAVLAASEFANRSGRDFCVALAVAYQVQCRLSDEAPVRDKGFDHTTQGSYAVAAGVSKALGLRPEQIANALAISGTAYNALRVTRTGALSNWKGLAYPNTAFGATHATLLASYGITGPLEVFEGSKGFMESIAKPFEIDWAHEKLDKIPQTSLKKYNAEIHSQSALEGILELREQYEIQPHDIVSIEVDIFDVAYNIIGGGEEGAKNNVQTKEEADHSLPYLIAVALLDGEVMPEQFMISRILRPDVQELLQKVTIRPSEKMSAQFPETMPCSLNIQLQDGKSLFLQKMDYEGFYKNPMSQEAVVQKFKKLTRQYIPLNLQDRLLDVVNHLEEIEIIQLTQLLSQIRIDATFAYT